MSNLARYADIAMSFMWILCYVLVLISTLKEKRPAMPVMACVFIFPWEFVMAISHITSIHTAVSYISIAHWGFALLDFSILILTLLGLKLYSIKTILGYLALTIVNTAVLVYIFSLPNGIFYTSYGCTILGMVFWLRYTVQPQYPRTGLNLCILLVKLFADTIAILTYFRSDCVGAVLSVLLPAMEAIQVLLFFRARPAANSKSLE